MLDQKTYFERRELITVGVDDIYYRSRLEGNLQLGSGGRYIVQGGRDGKSC